MSERSPEQIHKQIREWLDSLYRVDSGRILATLIRLLGDFDLAEEAMHEAFATALSLWPRSGVPDNPRVFYLRRRAEEERTFCRWRSSSARQHGDDRVLEERKGCSDRRSLRGNEGAIGRNSGA